MIDKVIRFFENFKKIEISKKIKEPLEENKDFWQ